MDREGTMAVSQFVQTASRSMRTAANGMAAPADRV